MFFVNFFFEKNKYERAICFYANLKIDKNITVFIITPYNMASIDYKTIITPMINRYDYLIDNGHICDRLPTNLSFGDMIDYVNNHLYAELETKMRDVSYSNKDELHRVVLNTTFNILDENEFINGDMRTVFETEFN